MALLKCACSGRLVSTKISVSGIRLNCRKCTKCGKLLVSGEEAFKFLSYRI